MLLQPESPEPHPDVRLEHARVVVDANVFARRERWMAPLVRAARAGYVVLFWSPAIIAEANRVLLWVWLQKRGVHMTDSLKREAFSVARRWFAVMTEVFKVVEDCPPYAPQWTSEPRDMNDRPIWTAAVRADAHFVVTENLSDGPPPNASGLRIWNGVLYVHPDQFLQALEWMGDQLEPGWPANQQDEITLSAEVLRIVQEIEARAIMELSQAEPPD